MSANNPDMSEAPICDPPRNIFNNPRICPKCGGLGFVRGQHGFEDYRDCPAKCANGINRAAVEEGGRTSP